MLVLGGLYVADAVGFDVWKLAAGVGIGGLAFALAAQDTVANVFGSVNIFVDRPFQIGDAVTIGSVEGVVEEVGFRSTRVRTFYNSVVTIPNSPDHQRERRQHRSAATAAGSSSPWGSRTTRRQTRSRPTSRASAPSWPPTPTSKRTYEVHLFNLGDSAIEILVYYHVKVVPGWHQELVTRSQNILEFLRLAEELGVSFAFPSQSLYLESTPDKPLPHACPGSALDRAEMQRIYTGFGPRRGPRATRRSPRSAAAGPSRPGQRIRDDRGSTTDEG